MQHEKVYNFEDLISPHGEDKVSSESQNGIFKISVLYDETKHLYLCFKKCTHFFRWSGMTEYPLLYSVDHKGMHPGNVYRLTESEYLKHCEDFATRHDRPYFQKKYFCIVFDSVGCVFHIVADDFYVSTA